MIFYILIGIALTFEIVCFSSLLKYICSVGRSVNFGVVIPFFSVLQILVAIILSPILISCYLHAKDLSVARNYNVVIALENSSIKLRQRLKDFDYPKGAILNADSPIASIIDQISVVEAEIRKARIKKEEAIVSIESRRIGLMPGVIGLVGDYK